MATLSSQVQILDKSNYTNHFIISVPDASGPLCPGTIRIQSRIISVTTNTFMYARLGHLLHWWDVWTAVQLFPAPYNDSSKYGRISSWGYAEVIESNHDKIPVGTKLFGYIPIGTYAEIMEVNIDPETGHLIEVSERRHNLMNMYNRYLSSPPTTDLSSKESRGWDSVMRVLFETSYLLSRYVFSWEARQSHPMGIPAPAPWSEQDADLTDAVVLLLGSSGKTALAFAYQLRYGRPTENQPKKIVAIGSQESRKFSEHTGLFDGVVLYSDSENPEVVDTLEIGRETKVLLVNFGARGEADLKWFTVLKCASSNVKTLIIGSDPKVNGRPKLAALAEDAKSGVVRGNASTLRDFAMATEGRTTYFKGLERDWTRFKDFGIVPGLRLEWGQGMGELRDGWDALCSGVVSPTVGLVYEV